MPEPTIATPPAAPGLGTADAPASKRLGRTPSVTRNQIFDAALALFHTKGFAATTVDDIATASGISRRTFFRYFATKNDLPWGDFDAQLSEMQHSFSTLGDATRLDAALVQTIIDFNTYPESESEQLFARMSLIFSVPALNAYGTLKYVSWRSVVADFVAARRGEAPSDLVPQSVAWACLGICLASYEHWLALPNPTTLELQRCIREAFQAASFQVADPTAKSPHA